MTYFTKFRAAGALPLVWLCLCCGLVLHVGTKAMAQSVTITSVSATCQSNGVINVADGTIGAKPFTYALLTGPDVPQPPAFFSSNITGGGGYTFTGLQSGTFTVGVVDNDGNENDFTVVVAGNYKVMDYTPVPSLNACANGTQTGKITVTGLVNGSPPYRYKLTKPTDTGFLNNGGVFDGLTPGQTYEVQVWDACDNFQTRQVQLPATAQPTVPDPVVSYMGCAGAVSATLTASGTSAPYTYQITAGPTGDPAVGTSNTTGVFTFQPNSTYTVLVTDACGGQTAKTFTQGGVPALEVFAFGAAGTGCTPGTTSGAGATYLIIKGGIFPYSSAVLEGTGGCTYGPTTLTNIEPNNSDGSYSTTLNNLPRPCSFKLTVTDACSNTMVQTFDQVTAGDGALGQYNYTSCPDGGSTAVKLHFAPTYGPPYAPTPPFSFTLVDNTGTPIAGYPVVSTDEQVVNLPAGVYTYIISDACGANTGPVSVTILPYQLPTLVLDATNLCINAGQVNLIGTNNNPYNQGGGTYSIISGPNRNGETNTSGVFSNLISGGAYTFGFNDGCQTVTWSVTMPPYQQPTFEVTFGAICPGQTLSSIQAFNLNPAAVVRPYSYEIIALNTTGGLTVPPQLDSLFTGLGVGQYNVRGSDACNNSFTYLGRIAPLPMPVIQANQGPYCVGQLFRIRIQQPVYGATYTYYRDGVQLLTTKSIVAKIPADAGKYSVVVSVASGGASCSATSDLNFNVNLMGNLVVNGPVLGCAGGTADLTAPAVTAGSDPGTLAYFQDAAATTPLDAGTGPANAITKAGTYYIQLTSSAGCIVVRQVTVGFRPAFGATLSSATICAGQTAVLAATGGDTYIYNPAGGTGNTLTVTPTTTTTYSVTAIDAFGCPSLPGSATVTVKQLPTLTVLSPVCQDATTFAVAFTATTGAIATASAGTVTGNTVTGVPTSVGTLTVTASLNGCPVTQSVNAPDCQPKLVLTKSVDKSVAQRGDIITYSVVLTNNGPVPATPVVVGEQFSPGAIYVDGSASAPAGSSVSITTTNGTSSGTWTVATITPGQSLTLSLQARADSAGVLTNTATIPGSTTAAVCTSVPLTACAGTPYAFTLTVPTGHTYQWYAGSTPLAGATASTLVVNAPGRYSVVIDATVNNPTGSCLTGYCCPFIVTETPVPSVTAVGQVATCNSQTVTVANADARIQLNGLGTGVFTYQISPASTFTGASPLSASPQPVPSGGLLADLLAGGLTYTVRITNAAGCFTDSTVTIPATTCTCPPAKCATFTVQQSRAKIPR